MPIRRSSTTSRDAGVATRCKINSPNLHAGIILPARTEWLAVEMPVLAITWLKPSPPDTADGTIATKRGA
jgi:hypothetical protein